MSVQTLNNRKKGEVQSVQWNQPIAKRFETCSQWARLTTLTLPYVQDTRYNTSRDFRIYYIIYTLFDTRPMTADWTHPPTGSVPMALSEAECCHRLGRNLFESEDCFVFHLVLMAGGLGDAADHWWLLSVQEAGVGIKRDLIETEETKYYARSNVMVRFDVGDVLSAHYIWRG